MWSICNLADFEEDYTYGLIGLRNILDTLSDTNDSYDEILSSVRHSGKNGKATTIGNYAICEILIPGGEGDEGDITDIYIFSEEEDALVDLVVMAETLINACSSWSELFKNAATVISASET